MTADYNPTQAQRLIAEAREDDARMIDAPWTAHRHHSRGPDDWVLTKSDETYELLQKDEALAIARTRNNMPALADQLESAGREVERLVKIKALWDEAAASLLSWLKGVDVEREQLRADAERLTHELDLMTKERDAKVESMVELCGDVDRAKQAGSDMCSTIERINAERDSLRVEVERFHQGCERADKAYADQRDLRAAAERERDSLRTERDALCLELERTRQERYADIGNYRAVNDSLLQQLEAAQRERDEALTDGVLSQRVCDIENDLAQSRSDLAAAQRRISELMGALDDARQQLEAAQRAHADDLEMFRATEGDLASHRRRADDAETGLTFAQQRISELEASQRTQAVHLAQLDGAQASLTDDLVAAQLRIAEAARTLSEWRQMYSDAESFHVERERSLLAALRAIWPVHRAAVKWSEDGVDSLLHVALGAADLAPEILAALKAAGLELE